MAVPDVRAAVDFYTGRLGFRLAFAEGEPPTFAGVNLGRVQIFLQQGTPSPGGSSVYFVVGDADELLAFHQANGVEVAQPIGDRPVRAARLRRARPARLLPRVRSSPARRRATDQHRARRRPGASGEAVGAYIQELKKKHGIDYDSHASYRFVE
ncbi:MAG TPA: VOC family protein [Thermoanaerobaculia bacterium]|nr:VOC family protein [Thermoanaerobaculia bacterium]